jgi:hypothetical protein
MFGYFTKHNMKHMCIVLSPHNNRWVQTVEFVLVCVLHVHVQVCTFFRFSEKFGVSPDVRDYFGGGQKILNWPPVNKDMGRLAH